MTFKIIGKKDEKKGFSIDSLIEIANGVRVKIKDLIALKNGEIKSESHDIDENAVLDLGNGVSVKLSDLVNQEIDLGNGKTAKLIDAIKSGKVKISNKAEDEGEKSDEDKAKEVEEGKKREKDIKNAAAMKNCSCGAKNGDDHKADCTGMKNETEDKDKELKNAKDKIAALENELKAKKEAIEHAGSFITIKNASKTNGSSAEVLLRNGTLNDGTMESGLARGLALFGTPNKN